ncbi:MAG: hypothetical protein M3M87_02330 [Thermoproteota archaeon]|nr:hypothetical protein [Thermoproteota archaeon]
MSNKVVAKIYTDLQVFTIYQIGICSFWCLQEAEWLPNHARSVLTLNPELNAESTIIFNRYREFIAYYTFTFHAYNRTKDVDEREEEENSHCDLISAKEKIPASMSPIVKFSVPHQLR